MYRPPHFVLKPFYLAFVYPVLPFCFSGFTNHMGYGVMRFFSNLICSFNNSLNLLYSAPTIPCIFLITVLCMFFIQRRVFVIYTHLNLSDILNSNSVCIIVLITSFVLEISSSDVQHMHFYIKFMYILIFSLFIVYIFFVILL